MSQTEVEIEERNVDSVLPLAWGSWDEMGAFSLQFYDVVFTEDFGPIPAGAQMSAVYVDYDEGILQGFDEESYMLSEVRWKAQAIVDIADNHGSG